MREALYKETPFPKGLNVILYLSLCTDTETQQSELYRKKKKASVNFKF